MDGFAEFSECLAATVREHGATGAVAGVLVGGERHVAAHGVTNAEFPRPLGAGSLFQVGSITKTFTAAAAGILAEEGRLAFDDPLARHLPGLARLPELDLDALTVEVALSHRSGFDGDHLLVFGGGRGLDALAGARRLFPTGEGFSYSNAAFSLAGAAVAAAAGTDFASFVRDRLLRPLGMRAATFRADEAITHDVAAPHWVLEGTSHVLRGAGWQPGWQLAEVDWPAGGLVASVDDLLAWCRFQRDGRAPDGTTLLGAETLARLQTPVVRADLVDRVALDWFVREIDGETAFGHSGLTVGYASDLVVVPGRDFGFAGSSNATNGGAVLHAVRRFALERFAGLVERDPAPDPSRDVDVSPYCGRYLNPFAELVVAPGDGAGEVVITSARRKVDGWQPPLDPPLAAACFAPDHVVTSGPGPARIGRFGPATGGGSAWLLWGHRRAPRVEDRDGDGDGEEQR